MLSLYQILPLVGVWGGMQVNDMVFNEVHGKREELTMMVYEIENWIRRCMLH